MKSISAILAILFVCTLFQSCKKEEPHVEFQFNMNQAILNDTVDFLNNSTNAYNYRWEVHSFSSNVPGSNYEIISSEKNLKCKFTESDQFEVILIATDKKEKKNYSYSQSINIE